MLNFKCNRLFLTIIKLYYLKKFIYRNEHFDLSLAPAQKEKNHRKKKEKKIHTILIVSKKIQNNIIQIINPEIKNKHQFV